MPISPEAAHHRARIAGLKRAIRAGERSAECPELVDAQRDLRTVKTAEYIRRIVDAAPPLTAEQRTRLAELLRPVRVHHQTNGAA
jgi:hypothetical protein